MPIASSTAPRHLLAQTFFAAGHGPAMVPAEERLEEKGETAQERFLGAQSPVEQSNFVADVFGERCKRFEVQVNLWPPARVVFDIDRNFVNARDVVRNIPVSDEDVIVADHKIDPLRRTRSTSSKIDISMANSASRS